MGPLDRSTFVLTVELEALRDSLIPAFSGTYGSRRAQAQRHLGALRRLSSCSGSEGWGAATTTTPGWARERGELSLSDNQPCYLFPSQAGLAQMPWHSSQLYSKAQWTAQPILSDTPCPWGRWVSARWRLCLDPK